MLNTLKTYVLTLFCALLLLSSASCFNVVTGGNVDKGWPRNNAQNPRHSGTTNKTDTVYSDKNDTIK